MRRRGKYNAIKTTVKGITFDSKKEAERYTLLCNMLGMGLISDLKLQPEWELIPRQGGFRPTKYVADFSYIKDGKLVVEDVKGVKTPEYRIKQKLMMWVHRIKVIET